MECLKTYLCVYECGGQMTTLGMDPLLFFLLHVPSCLRASISTGTTRLEMLTPLYLMGITSSENSNSSPYVFEESTLPSKLSFQLLDFRPGWPQTQDIHLSLK